jgi:transposase
VFPRIAKSKKKSGEYEYLVISESIHVKGKGSTTKNIANLGNVGKFTKNDIESLIDGLIRLFKVDKYGLADEVEIIESLEHGNIIFWRKLWDKMNLSGTIKRLIGQKESRIKIDVEKYVEIMVVNRCIEPLSKLGATRWFERTCYKAMKGYHHLLMDEEYFYRSMDYLLKIKDELEFEIFKRLKNLFSINVRLTFYDITSTFFYSDTCSISKYGYSRDHRPDKEQIVIGVVTSFEGYPIKHYVFEGNTKDEKTVIEVVKNLKEEYNIEETTFVGDRGMITKLNLTTIEQEGFDYIMGVKVRQSEIHKTLIIDGEIDDKSYYNYNGLKIQERDILIKDFLLSKIKSILSKNDINVDGSALDTTQQFLDSLANNSEIEYSTIKNALLSLTTESKIIMRISTLIKKYRGLYENKLRTIICMNEERKEIAEQRRKVRIANLSELLTKEIKSGEKNETLKLENKIDEIFTGHNRQYKKYFTIIRDKQKQKVTDYKLNNEAIAEEQRFDGIFILSTNRNDLEICKVVDSYKNLKEVEMLFDDLKNFVDIRPIRHWLGVRVRSHVFICILSLLLKRVFEISYMNGKAVMKPLEEISKSKLIKYEIKCSNKEERTVTFPKVTQTTQTQKEIFKMVGINNPMCLENYVW